MKLTEIFASQRMWEQVVPQNCATCSGVNLQSLWRKHGFIFCVCHFLALSTLEPLSPPLQGLGKVLCCLTFSPCFIFTSLFDLFYFFHSFSSQPNTCRCDQLSSRCTRTQPESFGSSGHSHLWTPRGANRAACPSATS